MHACIGETGSRQRFRHRVQNITISQAYKIRAPYLCTIHLTRLWSNTPQVGLKVGRTRKDPAVVSEARRQAVMRRHHPELFPPKAPQPPRDDPADELDRGDLPGFCSYDKAIGGNLQTYNDAVQREKAIAAELENEQLREAAEIRRKNLFTLEQLTKRDEERAVFIKGEMDALVDFAGSLVSPEQGAEARTKARAWANGFLGRFADRKPGSPA